MRSKQFIDLTPRGDGHPVQRVGGFVVLCTRVNDKVISSN